MHKPLLKLNSYSNIKHENKKEHQHELLLFHSSHEHVLNH